jgi:aspartate carbamoyltransferase catalytic subunit
MAKNSDAKINGDFKGKDILSLDQFSPSDIDLLFQKTNEMKLAVSENKPLQLLAGYVVGLIFYEPSSRTFGSFASAAKRLGGATIEYTNPKENTSVAKGESLEDTMQTIQSYAEAIVIRHPEAGSAKKAADAADVPILNAGDGGNAHPTQGLLDLFTLYDKFERLENLTVVASGDVLHSRTIHSLIEGLSLYKNNTVYLLSPEALKLGRDYFDTFSKRGIKLVEIFDEKDIPTNANAWYWNRIQKERFATPEEAKKYEGKFIVTAELVKTYGNQDMIIMDPLPRVGEIDVAVDSDPRAVYLKTQMRNGMYVRMALLALVLGKI